MVNPIKLENLFLAWINVTRALVETTGLSDVPKWHVCSTVTEEMCHCQVNMSKVDTQVYVWLVWFMVFNATFNNISVISWWKLLFRE